MLPAQRERRIRGLVKERAGYVMKADEYGIGLVDDELQRLQVVDEELAQFAVEGRPPAKRATRRTRRA